MAYNWLYVWLIIQMLLSISLKARNYLVQGTRSLTCFHQLGGEASAELPGLQSCLQVVCTGFHSAGSSLPRIDGPLQGTSGAAVPAGGPDRAAPEETLKEILRAEDHADVDEPDLPGLPPELGAHSSTWSIDDDFPASKTLLSHPGWENACGDSQNACCPSIRGLTCCVFHCSSWHVLCQALS